MVSIHALNGYVRPGNGDPNWAFFPLYPLIVHLARVTGDFALDGLIVSNFAFTCSIFLLGKIALKHGLPDDDAERAMFYLAFFPTSYFFSLPLTESTFLALSLAAVLAAQHGTWWAAGLCGGLSALTRFAGLLLLPLLVLMLLRQEKPQKRSVVWIALVPAGTASFMLYLYSITGDPLAFLHAQSRWGRSARWFWTPLFQYLRNASSVSEPWNPLLLNFGIAVALLVIGGALLVRRDWAFGTYTLLSVLLPLSSGSLQSMDRYAVVVFPVFLWLAKCGRNR